MQFGYLYKGSSSLGGGSIHACLGAVGGGGGDCHHGGTCGQDLFNNILKN